MEEMVTVYLLGKKYSVPATLTIMDAMEYAGFKLVRGCGCRSGFCGACAVIYRLKGSTELKVVLSCQTKVEEGMCVGKIDSFPINKRTLISKRLRQAIILSVSCIRKFSAALAAMPAPRAVRRA